MPGWLDSFNDAERRYFAEEREKREQAKTNEPEPEPERVCRTRRYVAWRPQQAAPCDGCRYVPRACPGGRTPRR